ncbi:D-alanyl-D-alanine carboxypeptidase/D-alanyl-D-alanine endopeptidase [Paraoerskovia marina]|uniref:D-alanyl-D-alanine carboxypeptidase/D-alanyl-D-alanine endopeptidase n=1 Tax=Paraoerskovia marina TaxID=545619 RepID=UPI00200ABE17|nr:D-alanyl-D-alanine carboxypeptidase/D-alanyl-D-alanine-endopeptidase [Paraoerskovia marina]
MRRRRGTAMGWGAKAGSTVAAVLLLTGVYLTLDAYDVVPGLLTTEPAPAPAAPFPDSPGAVAGEPPELVTVMLGEDAPVPAAASVQSLVDDLADDDRLGTRVGVSVVDAASGETLGTHAPDASFVPASTQKLLTAVAALSTITPGTRFPTTVEHAGDGLLVLRGGGDTLLAAGAGDPDAVNGHAGLGDLADQVAGELTLTGDTSVTLRVDDSLFTGPSVSPTWDPGFVTDGYASAVTALAVDGARLEDDEYAPRADDPSLAAGEIFAEALADRGITVDGDVKRATVEASPLVGAVQSAPVEDIVGYFLEHSDNSVTEAVGRLVALQAGREGSFDGATSAVTTAVERLGVDLTGAELVDCSGLGEGSDLSPTQLTDVVELITDPEQPRLRPAAVQMPIAGLTGTLDDRFVGDPGAGVTRAKTGSLSNVRSLSGTTVTDDGRMLAFAVLADKIPDENAWGAPFIIDDFVDELASCGCTG